MTHAPFSVSMRAKNETDGVLVTGLALSARVPSFAQRLRVCAGFAFGPLARKCELLCSNPRRLEVHLAAHDEVWVTATFHERRLRNAKRGYTRFAGRQTRGLAGDEAPEFAQVTAAGGDDGAALLRVTQCPSARNRASKALA